MQTDLTAVKLIVRDAVRRERAFMLMTVVVTGVALMMLQSQTVRSEASNKDAITSSHITSAVFRTRRILQQQDPALVQRAVNELKTLVEVLERDMAKTAFDINSPQQEPAMEVLQPLMVHSSNAPAPEPSSSVQVPASEACACPPGPRGPPVSAFKSFLPY